MSEKRNGERREGDRLEDGFASRAGGRAEDGAGDRGEDRAAERLGDRLGALQRRLFVGRGFELGFFAAFLGRGSTRAERVVNVYGDSGVGKSFLLDRWRELAAERGRAAVFVDIRGAGRSVDAEDAIRDAWSGAADDAVLVLDHCDELGAAEQWLRESFLPGLRADALVVMASRRPLEGPWAIDPAWRSMTVHLRLEPLGYEEVREYASRLGLSDEAGDSLWVRSMGHPLAMALCGASTAGPAMQSYDSPEQWDALVRHWAGEAANEALSELLSAASIPLRFDQEALSGIVGEDVPDLLFDRLVRLSFLRRTERGWGMHDTIRDAFRRSLRARKPSTFERCRERWISLVAERLERRLGGRRPVAQELGELLQYLGSPVLRAHYRQSGFSANYLEQADESTLPEVEAYLRRRRDTAKRVRIRCSDPESGTLFRYDLDAERSLLRLTGVDPRRLLEWDRRSLRIVRDPAGAVVGLVAAVPIHRDTVPHLREWIVARAYFASLSDDRLRPLLSPPERPAGWYLLSVDMDDLEREDRRSDIVRIMLDAVLTGGLTVASPPPLPHYEEVHKSMGFETVPGATHYDYDGSTPTATYVVDVRDERLTAWLRGTIGPSVARREKPLRQEGERQFDFTPREAEVAKHLVNGATNGQIASRMYISEAAVKKHIQSMLGKAEVRNRTQLVARLLERP
ncbi:LuxR C-terminal-related transcriptional regulator [Paenibacillus sp.]|uniref:LuxR C-terminal-related transcriptional regulator n=1 Tax=Paenibacillus sp. TaxID=58172 RepID=UPI002811A15A|nr:LuxR C-terminal-related transcriptional regulator [Paenibacillus sp.]